MQLTLVKNEDGFEELTLIELQGSLEIHKDIGGLKFGDIRWEDQKALLCIGNNMLEGKFIQLDKPLLLMDLKSQSKNFVRIQGIIERKLLFCSRPKPILSGPERK
uniref:Uncharacterized protein n=2 Tax=Panagrolaimus sp. JU765 TaxID=591449 RepID=A0AC34R0D5_9BILA